MSIQDKISSCRIIMGEVQSNKVEATQISERARINNSFFDAYNDFLLPNLKGYVVVKENTTFIFSPNVIKKLIECLNVVSEAVDKGQVLSKVSSFRANAIEVRDKLSEEWSNHCTEITTDIIGNLGVLRLVYPDKAQVNRIISSISGVKVWPVTEEQLSDYNEAVEKANALLKHMDFDPVVDTFLRKVRDRNATLEDLTDPIIKWIRDNDFEKSIRLTII